MMRSLLLAALGITPFSATMAVETPEANAVVYCAAGVYRAGCVVRPGVASVRGVARRTTRRVVRRSDMMLKHDISLLGHLDNGVGFYRFSYNGSDKAYVGVMAQEVQTVMPAAVLRGSDGYLRVFYDKLGLKFQTYDQWTASGAHVPAGTPVEQQRWDKSKDARIRCRDGTASSMCGSDQAHKAPASAGYRAAI